jgi:hypothetical protein
MKEPVGRGGELVAAMSGAEPPGATVVFEVGTGAGLDGHAAHRIGGHRGKLPEPAVFEPEDAVGDLLEAVIVGDDQDASTVVDGELAQQAGNVPPVAGVEVGGRFVGKDHLRDR